MLNIPTKPEVYKVAARKLTERELNQLIRQTVNESRIWFDEPRSWLTYDGFLGFQIHRAVVIYQLDAPEINTFVTECYNTAMSEGLLV
jgi:hypothetical protein